jgi:sialidase-1
VLYSNDNGKTWRTSPLLGTLENIISPNETVAAELPCGKIYLAIRQNAPERAHALLASDACTVLEYSPVDGVQDPVCFGSAVSLAEKLIFINCDSKETRQNLTLKVSTDGGKAWKNSLVISKDRGGYADIAADPKQKKIYAIYENEYGKELYFTVIEESELA